MWFKTIVLMGRWIQAMWKLSFHKVELSDLHKIGKYCKEIGEIINNIGKNQNSVDTASAPEY